VIFIKETVLALAVNILRKRHQGAGLTQTFVWAAAYERFGQEIREALLAEDAARSGIEVEKDGAN
jgi:hypothetical protein